MYMRDTYPNPVMKLVLHRTNRIISLLMIFIMAALPVMSMMLSSKALASIHSHHSDAHVHSHMTQMSQMSHKCCKQMGKQTLHNAMSDCCKHCCTQNCAHGDSCQCDSAQTGFTLINATLTNPLSLPARSIFQRKALPLKIANTIDLLYRPPITIL